MSSTDEIAAAFREVADEFVESIRLGRNPSVEEYAARYPEFAEKIRDLLPTLLLMEKVKSPEESPESHVGPTESSMVGRKLGDYEILREVGRGGMGVVYEAEQISLGRQVALKVMPKQGPFNSNQQIRFEREAKSAARLHHTNIVPVFGVGEEDDLCYFVMQFINGLGLDKILHQLRIVRKESDPKAPSDGKSEGNRDLRSLLSRKGSGAETSAESPRESEAPEPDRTGDLLNEDVDLADASESATGFRPSSSHDSSSTADPYWRNIAGIGMQVSDALQYAHEQGVTHRDIKPSNLLLDVRRTVWVTDFGLAKADDEANITRSGDVLGTIRYMPPEAFEGQFDARGDLYSLGITLYEFATLTPAFSGSGRRELVKRVVSDLPEPVSKLAPKIPRDLATIIDKAIERDPKDRYQTAADFHEDLRRFVHDEPIRARRVSFVERLGRWSRRNRALAVSLLSLTALLLVMAIGGVTAAIYFFEQEEEQRLLFTEAQALAVTNQRLLNESIKFGNQAESARNEALHQAELTRRNLYSANMLNALAAVEGHRGYSRTQLLLDRWRPDDDEDDLRGWEWYYVQSLCHQHEFALHGHEDSILAISLDNTGDRLASASHDGTLAIWDLNQQRMVRQLPSPVGILHCVAWDPRDRFIVAGGANGMVVWAVDSWEQVHQATGRTVYGLQWSPDGRWLARSGKIIQGAGREDEIALIDPVGFRTDTRLPGIAHTYNALQLSFSADGKRVAYPSLRDACVWDLEAAEFVLREQHQDAELQTIRFHPTDPDVIFEGGRDAIGRRIDLRTKSVTVEYVGHTHAISQCAWHPDGTQIATASWDGSVRIWNADSGELLRLINGHDRHVFSVAWSPDGKRLLSAGNDQVIKCWQSGRPAGERRVGSVNGLMDCPLSADDSLLAAASSRGDLRLYNVSDGSLQAEFANGRNQIWAADFSPDGKRLVSVGARRSEPAGLVRVWDVASGDRDLEYEPSHVVRSADWSSNGRLIALGLVDGTMELFEPELGTVQDRIATRLQSVNLVQFGPGSELLAFGGHGGFGLLHVATGEIEYWPDSLDTVEDLEWSRSGTMIAASTFDQHIAVWDVATRTRLIEFRNHFEPIYALKWGPEDRRLLSVDARGTLALWDYKTGQSTLKLQTGYGRFRAANWTADGFRIISHSDNEFAIFDATRGYAAEAQRQNLAAP